MVIHNPQSMPAIAIDIPDGYDKVAIDTILACTLCEDRDELDEIIHKKPYLFGGRVQSALFENNYAIDKSLENLNDSPNQTFKYSGLRAKLNDILYLSLIQQQVRNDMESDSTNTLGKLESGLTALIGIIQKVDASNLDCYLNNHLPIEHKTRVHISSQHPL